MRNLILSFLFFITLFGNKGVCAVWCYSTLIYCDITQVDSDNNGTPDGIINLYEEYTKQTGQILEKGFLV
jgi:hypothetical protein